MATYIELRSLYGDENLSKKVEVAVSIAAQKIAGGNDGEAPFDQTAGKHDLRIKWAQAAIMNTARVSEDVLKLVLAANNGLSVAQITGASDAAIQLAVESVVDALAAV